MTARRTLSRNCGRSTQALWAVSQHTLLAFAGAVHTMSTLGVAGVHAGCCIAPTHSPISVSYALMKYSRSGFKTLNLSVQIVSSSLFLSGRLHRVEVRTWFHTMSSCRVPPFALLTTHYFYVDGIKPFWLFTLNEEEAHLCPIRALANWIGVSRLNRGYLFRRIWSGDCVGDDDKPMVRALHFVMERVLTVFSRPPIHFSKCSGTTYLT